MALLGFLLIRGLLTGLVGGVWGQTTPHFPLYAVEAICVEVVALLLSTRKPVLFGAVSGAAIGTFGLAAEWGWSHVWMTMSWPSSLLPEGVIFGLLAAVSGGVLGGAIGRALAPPVEDLAPSPRWAVALAGIGLVVAVAFPLPISAPENVSAQVTLTDATGPPKRTVDAEVKLDPAGRRRGRGVVQVDRVAGRRLDRLRHARGLPRRLPHDEADPGLRQLEVDAAPAQGLRRRRPAGLPAGGSRRSRPRRRPAEAGDDARRSCCDKKNLQREQKQDVPGYLTTIAYLLVLLIVIGIIAALAIGLRRMDRDRDAQDASAPSERAPARRPLAV